ncbi:MAG: hypothetical protein JWP49_779 [Phenylobacterium sp.]|jgi:hypothetical protein|nr:hypothetical protein [Phenylobacterium sp.]
MTDDADLRRLATRRADMKLGFRSHLLAYAVVNAGLLLINLATSPDHLWFYWPMLGWGVGLAAHAVAVYADGENIRERMIEAEFQKLRRRASEL